MAHEWIVASQGQTIAQLTAAQVALGNTVIFTDEDNSRVLVDTPSGGSGLANALTYKGATDCSGNPNYPAADAGDLYMVSVAGKIGGASGTVVEVGDMFICKTDGTTSGTQAQKGTAWNVVQGNLAGPIPVKASGAEIVTGTDDEKFATGKSIKDAGIRASAGAADFGARELFASNGTTVQLDWSGDYPDIPAVLPIFPLGVYLGNPASDASSFNSSGEWTDASLGRAASADFRTLYDNTGTAPSIVWKDRNLIANDGTTVMADWHDPVGLAQRAPAASPAAILANGQISFYLDEVGNKLKVAVKYSDGTTKTGEVTLT